ncbi:MAG: hypothetical protein OXI76_04165 [Gemmatimonadota bacterium]|nr:hypothetical protein [Gemmatimonadota bacterium]
MATIEDHGFRPLATGHVTGPHLHWVVRYGSTTVDPMSLLALVR